METQNKEPQAFYYWKQATGINWIGLSVAHNKREQGVVERYIKKQLQISLAKTLYKKVVNDKIIKTW